MKKSKTKDAESFEVTPAVVQFMTYFAKLGPRWGLAADTCRVHALLYLAARPLTSEAIVTYSGLTKKRALAAIEDLIGWRVAAGNENGISIIGGEPVDLMFSALEERARREISPALQMLRTCRKAASEDGATLAPSMAKISAMLQLVEDLSALEIQSGRFTSRPFSRLVKVGGRAARLLDRTFPRSRKKTRV